MPSGTMVHTYLVDDGSTDGTAEAVRVAYPRVELLEGDGCLFWNGGMRRAFSEALRVGYDYYLWLNDDTLLHPGALLKLLDTHNQLRERGLTASIVVGSTQDATTGTLTYGGVVRASRWLPLKFRLVEPYRAEPRECETMNGNCVLIPRVVAERVGNLDSVFSHKMGDMDYALRARRMGCSVWVAPGYVGHCSINLPRGNWADPKLPLVVRLRKLHEPKAFPPKEWATFTRRYAGPLSFAYRVWPYVRVVATWFAEKARVLLRRGVRT